MLKLKRFKEGVWVTYPKAEGVRFKVRPSSFTQSMGILAEIKEKRIVEGWPIDPRDPSKKGPTVVDDYKDGVFLWKVFDNALEAWEGVDPVPEGEEVALTPDEVKHLIYDNDELREFIFRSARELLESETSNQERERKNL